MSRHEQEIVGIMPIEFFFHMEIKNIESYNMKLNFGRYKFKFNRERRMTKNK